MWYTLRIFPWALNIPYILHFNDIVKASNFNTFLYADDINKHMSEKNHKISEKLVNNELKKIDHWVRANKLCINYTNSNDHAREQP